MVVTRSQSDRVEAEERRRELRENQSSGHMDNPGAALAQYDTPESPSDITVQEVPPIEIPMEPRLGMPSTSGVNRRVAFATQGAERRGSLTASRCSSNTALRMRQAERDAEERMMALQRQELEKELEIEKKTKELEIEKKTKELEMEKRRKGLELELERRRVQLQLSQQLDTLEAEGSHCASVVRVDPHQAVDQWLDRCEEGTPPTAGPSQPTAQSGERQRRAIPAPMKSSQPRGERQGRASPEPLETTQQSGERQRRAIPAPMKSSQLRGERQGRASPEPLETTQQWGERERRVIPTPMETITADVEQGRTILQTDDGRRWRELCVGETPQTAAPAPPATPQEERRVGTDLRSTSGKRDKSATPTQYRSDIEELAHTLQQMSRPQARHPGELPAFSGAPGEWLAFKAAVRDSITVYRLTDAENIQRLRSSLRGEAREAVSALLHSATSTEVIMKTLEQSFGRPEVIIDRTMEDLKRLLKPGSSASELNKFAVKLQNTVCVLQSIDRRGYLHNPLMVREVLDKLSPHIRSRWCDYAVTQENVSEPEVVTLSRFLMREADMALRFMYTPNVANERSRPAETRPEKPTAPKWKAAGKPVYTIAEEERPDPCPSCKRAHTLPNCAAFKEMNVEQRWELVRKSRLCFRCIVSKHRRYVCKAKLCEINKCERPHHQMLHTEQEAAASQAGTASPARVVPPTDPKAPAEPEEAVLSVTSVGTADPEITLLRVCPVIVKGPRGEVEAYALLDEGATVSLVDETLARSVGAEGPTHTLRLCGVNMAQEEQGSRVVSITLRGVGKDKSFPVEMRTIKDLRLHKQRVTKQMADYEHLRDLQLPTYPEVRPRILVGADHLELIVTRELRVGKKNQPAASKTQLGWVLLGRLPRSLIYSKEDVLHTYAPSRRSLRKECYPRSYPDTEEARPTMREMKVHHYHPVVQRDVPAKREAATSTPLDTGGGPEQVSFYCGYVDIRDQQRSPTKREALSDIAPLQIEEDDTEDQRRWLPMRDNVADDATQHSSATITVSNRCFMGPTSLRQLEEDCPYFRHEEEEQVKMEACLHLRHEEEEPVETEACLHLRHEEEEPVEMEDCLHLRHEEEEPVEMRDCLHLRHEEEEPVEMEDCLHLRHEDEEPDEREHAAAGHAHRERVTDHVPQRQWVLRLQPAVRAVKKSCAYCRHLRAKKMTSPTGDLPLTRLDPFRHPCSNKGKEYFSPIPHRVKIGRSRKKRTPRTRRKKIGWRRKKRTPRTRRVKIGRRRKKRTPRQKSEDRRRHHRGRLFPATQRVANGRRRRDAPWSRWWCPSGGHPDTQRGLLTTSLPACSPKRRRAARATPGGDC